MLNPLTSIARLRRKPRLPSGEATGPGLVVGHHRWRVVGPMRTFGLLEAWPPLGHYRSPHALALGKRQLVRSQSPR
jgi:hypothetical protein